MNATMIVENKISIVSLPHDDSTWMLQLKSFIGKKIRGGLCATFQLRYYNLWFYYKSMLVSPVMLETKLIFLEIHVIFVLL